MASISIIEAVHELRQKLNIDLRRAISQMIGLLAEGRLPSANAVIDGKPAKIDPRWWWAGAIEYPNSTATFRLEESGRPTPVCATDVTIDRDAWDRLLPDLRPEPTMEEWAEGRLLGSDNMVTAADRGAQPNQTKSNHVEPQSTDQLTGKRLEEALYQWARDRWGPGFEVLPSREDLLVLARDEVSPNVAEHQVRALRKRCATPEAKKGGAPLHRK